VGDRETLAAVAKNLPRDDPRRARLESLALRASG